MLAVLLLCPIAFLRSFVPQRAWAEPSKGTRAVLELFVDGVDKGAILAVIHGKEILASVPGLKKAGVTTVEGKKETVGGTVFVALSSLAPNITYSYDEAQLVLRLTVKPALLKITKFNLLKTEPKDLVYSEATSGFINYALTSHNLAAPNFFSEQGFSFDGDLFDNTLTLANGSFVRGNTSFSLDNRADMTRLAFGDAFANGGRIGGGSYIGGVTYAKNFSINPYFISYPMQHLAGTVNAPATADVYVNGLLVRSITLQPGRFDLQNIPVGAGAGATRVVIRNVFGQKQEIQAPFYLSPGVLKRGLSQYTFSLGMERGTAASEFGDYPRPAALAHYRYGWNDDVTPGFLLENDGTAITGGPELTMSLPFGQLGLSGAGSCDKNANGFAYAVQYNYQSHAFQIGADLQAETSHYAALGLRPQADRTLRSYDLFYGMPIGRVDISAQYSHLDDRDLGPSNNVSLTTSTPIDARIQLFATFSHFIQAHSPVDNSIFLGLSFALTRDTSGTVSAQRSQGHYLETAQIEKALPIDTGFGYNVQGQIGQNSVQQANLQYQGPYGLYEADNSRSQGQENTQLNVSGGLALIGGRLMPTLPIHGAYALVRVPGVKGVGVYLSNQKIGKTDSDGDLLVPKLQSYLGNRLSINDIDVPINYAIASARRVIAPPYHGGAVVVFPVERLQAMEGDVKVVRNGKTSVPTYGEMDVTVDGKTVSSPIGTGGAFYFETLPPGRHPATVISTKGVRCDFDLDVPKATGPVTKMGTVTCVHH